MRRPIALAIALLATSAAAQLAPIPHWVRSLSVSRPGTTVRARPDAASARRGTVQVGTRLPFVQRVQGDGCPGGEWMQVGPEAFVCETLLQYSPEEPGGEEVPAVPPGQLLPREYAFVSTDGTWAYARPSDYFADRWVETLGEGFGVAIVEHTDVGGTRMARTLNNLWLPMSELHFARPSDFAGVELAEGQRAIDIAWVIRDQAVVRERAGGPVVDRAPFHQLVRLNEVVRGNARVALIGPGGAGDDRWIALRDLARPSSAPPPSELGEGERWIDVELATQTLVAYVGPRPVYATLVSTGLENGTTPRGVHRIWVKLAENDMDDLEREDVIHNYHIQAVPWVQYFAGDVGLHAAFWHDRFGHRRSHGCVNLSPRDARWLFAFTQPALPLGWDAIVTTDRQRGSIVRVR